MNAYTSWRGQRQLTQQPFCVLEIKVPQNITLILKCAHWMEGDVNN